MKEILNMNNNNKNSKQNMIIRQEEVAEIKDLKVNISSHSHFGHRERLRGLVNNTDILSLPEHQILELMLTFVLPQRDVNPLAHNILNEFGSLANVFEASVENLMKVKGVEDQLVTIGIRPEGFVYSAKGPLTLKLSNVEVMGRDVSVVSTSEYSQNPTVRAIIDADNKIDVTKETVKFSIKPNKIFLFNKETEERILF